MLSQTLLQALLHPSSIKTNLCFPIIITYIFCSLFLLFLNLQTMLFPNERALTGMAMPWQKCDGWCTGAPGRCGRSPCCTKFAGHSGFCSGPRALNEANGAARLRQDEPEDEPTDQLQRRSSGIATFLVIRGLHCEGWHLHITSVKYNAAHTCKRLHSCKL